MNTGNVISQDISPVPPVLPSDTRLYHSIEKDGTGFNTYTPNNYGNIPRNHQIFGNSNLVHSGF